MKVFIKFCNEFRDYFYIGTHHRTLKSIAMSKITFILTMIIGLWFKWHETYLLSMEARVGGIKLRKISDWKKNFNVVNLLILDNIVHNMQGLRQRHTIFVFSFKYKCEFKSARFCILSMHVIVCFFKSNMVWYNNDLSRENIYQLHAKRI